jgi:hypothetical protein
MARKSRYRPESKADRRSACHQRHDLACPNPLPNIRRSDVAATISLTPIDPIERGAGL